MIDPEKLNRFIKHVRKASDNPDFIHYQWFVRFHLEIVEKIALEACGIYPNADRDFVRLLCWLHDYGKILDFSNQYDVTITEGRKKLKELGFNDEVTNRALESIRIIDAKIFDQIKTSPIEVKIVSSSDAASHHVGPFFTLWWYENPDRTIEQLMEDNMKKSDKDWDRKMVLPEIREAFKGRRKYIEEMSGKLPGSYL
ncbi:hypothetical protein KA068_02365 [Candidatus Saccharibacteria bacterium]|nr:hypothetical protein [Candidatus Saccharibacteria bacterium]